MSEPNSKKFKMNKETKTDSSSASYSGGSKRLLTDVSTPDFATIKETLTFVDKTPFIESFLTDGFKKVLLTAPRAFGKSTLMNMLKQFLLGKTSLFENLKIYENQEIVLKYCSKPHPVIHIDLTDVCGTNFVEVKRELAGAVNNAFEEHQYLVEETDDGASVWASEKLRNRVWRRHLKTFEKYSDIDKCKELDVGDLVSSIDFLSRVLHTHYEEKVFILIDEYDALAVSMISTTRWNQDEMAAVDNLLKKFMTATLKTNMFVERSLIFACVRLAGAYSGNAARVIHHYPFLRTPKYAPYFGFTEEEVKQLLQRTEVKDICGDPKTIGEWYDGYIVLDNDKSKDSDNDKLKIYSSWSILNYLENSIEAKKPIFSSYWIETGHVQNINSLFAEPSIRKKIEQVLNDHDGIKIRTVDSVTLENLQTLNKLIYSKFDELNEETMNLFFQFLADSGYFNTIKKDGNVCTLKVPNSEIRKHLQEICYSKALNIIKDYNLERSVIETYVNALIAVLEDTNEQSFVKFANAVVALFSKKNITNESEFQNVLFALAFDSSYFVARSEVQIKKRKKGRGIAPTIDLLITTKGKGMILELKVNSKSAEDALKQIEKLYYTKFEEPDYEDISYKIYAGLSYNSEEKKVYIAYKVGINGEIKSVCSDG